MWFISFDRKKNKTTLPSQTHCVIFLELLSMADEHCRRALASGRWCFMPLLFLYTWLSHVGFAHSRDPMNLPCLNCHGKQHVMCCMKLCGQRLIENMQHSVDWRRIILHWPNCWMLLLSLQKIWVGYCWVKPFTTQFWAVIDCWPVVCLCWCRYHYIISSRSSFLIHVHSHSVVLSSPDFNHFILSGAKLIGTS